MSSRELKPISDMGMLAERPCCHLIRERGVSWTDHQACGRSASFVLTTLHEGETITLPLCRTHAKLKLYQPKP